MRVLFTLVFLVTLFAASVHGQQSNQMFQINDPLQGEGQVPVELLYFDESQESTACQTAPPTMLVPPSLDERTLTPRNSMPMLGSAQTPKQRPTHSPNPKSVLKNVSVSKNKIGFVPGSISKDGSPRATVQTYDGVAVKNRFFFGVDRESCCDEWRELCGCGGLKANSGHCGQPWIRGCDACEENCRRGKHGQRHKRHRKKCLSCDDSSGSACGD